MAHLPDGADDSRPEQPGSREAPRQRRAGRVRAEGLCCDRGRVTDMSLSGMRLLTRRAWQPGETRPITLRSAQVRLTLPATCAWNRREGLLRWSVGVNFDAATPAQQGVVAELARTHAARLLRPVAA